MNRKKIKRGPGKQGIKGKHFLLAKEITYIQDRAAEHDGRLVTIGPLALFSTATGDAWMLDPTDQFAARLARDGDPEPIEFEETDTNFAISWKGTYRIEGWRIRVRGPRFRPDHYNSWLSCCQNCSIGLNSKFQICLARLSKTIFRSEDR